MILDLLLITIILCYIIDLSGVIDSLKTPFAYLLSKIYKTNIPSDAVTIPKPFSCSKCMVLWSGLLYLILTNQFNILNITICTLFSLFSSNVTGFLSFIKELLVYLENKLFEILQN